MQNIYNIPILIIAFNRIDTLKKLIPRILELKPVAVYIAVDGPRIDKKGEAQKVNEVINYLESSFKDIPTLRTQYSQYNQGCRWGVSNAISWFFNYEKLGIILEDDILPEPDFFTYMDKLLNLYKNNSRIGHISGANLLPDLYKGTEEYYPVIRGSVWGWGSWKRAWDNYDSRLASYSPKNYDSALKKLGIPKKIRDFKVDCLNRISSGDLDTWDYIWDYSLVNSNLLAINPSGNLINNIGFSSDATHTTILPVELSNWEIKNINTEKIYGRKISKPLIDQELKEFDKFVNPNSNLNSMFVKASDILKRLIWKIKIFIKKIGWRIRHLLFFPWVKKNIYIKIKSVTNNSLFRHAARDINADPILMINSKKGAGGAARIVDSLMDGLTQKGYKTSLHSAATFQKFELGKTHRLSRETADEEGLLDLGIHNQEYFNFLMKSEKFSVIHLHNIHGGYFNFLDLPQLSKIAPLVWTLHDMWSFTGHCGAPLDCTRWLIGCGYCPYPEVYPRINKDRTNELHKIKKSLYSKININLVVPSIFLLNQVKKSILSHSNVRVIPNGIDTTIFSPGSKQDSRMMLGLPLNKKLILFVADGGLSNKFKGGELIKNALAGWPFGEALLVIVGNGNRRYFDGRVFWFPYETDLDKMKHFYRACDIFINPSLGDVFSLVTAEAVACGTPVVAFSTGGIPEILQETGGVCVPTGDSFNLFKETRILLNKPAKVYPLPSKYTISNMINSYLNLYSEIIEETQKGLA